MGACTLYAFYIIYGANGGNLGRECNQRYSDACVPVFRARAAHLCLGDIYSNQFLSWWVITGGLSVVPVVYISFLNTRFFKRRGITWEWALSVGFIVVFTIGIELWKLTRRHFHLLEDMPIRRGT
ncbi:hypothetical protein B0J15DRAFT_552622 [Fusarium solani]|uniref:Uncharacterized protein n=1 Tax=Fusarium solani TaxID=169388 RepID=A0A9P9GS73_FUSSL|nr:uncharacterized protein B0J15DRAFT_552622 [Fusarium solani]KAH7243755.1 hypothetical protein B0J15DRAFT_552622 [Fusarium solani]